MRAGLMRVNIDDNTERIWEMPDPEKLDLIKINVSYHPDGCGISLSDPDLRQVIFLHMDRFVVENGI
jgi:hypothetical protein